MALQTYLAMLPVVFIDGYKTIALKTSVAMLLCTCQPLRPAEPAILKEVLAHTAVRQPAF